MCRSRTLLRRTDRTINAANEWPPQVDYGQVGLGGPEGCVDTQPIDQLSQQELDGFQVANSEAPREW